jgi:hypothetical protein
MAVASHNMDGHIVLEQVLITQLNRKVDKHASVQIGHQSVKRTDVPFL